MKRDEYRRHRGCTIKVKYSKSGAEKVAAQLQERNLDLDRPIEAYKCGYCKRYHVGHRAAKKPWEVDQNDKPPATD